MEKVQGRLDAIIAFAGPRVSQEAERFQVKYRVNEILQDIKTRLDILQPKDGGSDVNLREVAEQFREEIEQLKNKYIVVRERRSSLRERLGFYKRSMLKSHPSITSRKFADALQELKEIAQPCHLLAGFIFESGALINGEYTGLALLRSPSCLYAEGFRFKLLCHNACLLYTSSWRVSLLS